MRTVQGLSRLNGLQQPDSRLVFIVARLKLVSNCNESCHKLACFAHKANESQTCKEDLAHIAIKRACHDMMIDAAGSPRQQDSYSEQVDAPGSGALSGAASTGPGGAVAPAAAPATVDACLHPRGFRLAGPPPAVAQAPGQLLLVSLFRHALMTLCSPEASLSAALTQDCTTQPVSHQMQPENGLEVNRSLLYRIHDTGATGRPFQPRPAPHCMKPALCACRCWH